MDSAFSAIVMLLLVGSGGGPSDLVSIMDANAYFQSRNIQVTVDKMAELAAQDPVDGKTQIAQLLALRTLGTDAAEVKKAKNFAAILKTVEEIADGKKAQDPQGFAADYARLTAVALGSKTVEPPQSKLPDNSARQEALSWFPDSAKMVMAMDIRATAPLTLHSGKVIRASCMKLIGAGDYEEIFKVADQVGNVRFDRVAMAFAPDAQNPAQSRIFVRITGKGDHKRLADHIENDAAISGKEVTTFRGQRITTLYQVKGLPALALVGDTDFLLADFEASVDGHAPDVLLQMLDVRSGKAKSVLTGPLAASLKKLSPQANGVFVGEFPPNLRRQFMGQANFPPFPQFMRGRGSFQAFPKTAIAELLRDKGDLALHLLQASLDNDPDAKQFTEDVERIKKTAIDGIKEAQQNIPANIPIPPKAFEQMKKALESIKVEANGASVQGKATVSPEVFDATFKEVGKEIKPPPPPKKDEDVKKDKESRRAAPGRTLAMLLGRSEARLTLAPEAVACLHEYANKR